MIKFTTYPLPLEMMKSINKNTSRRNFLKTSSLAAASFSIVPSYVMAGSGKIAPSDKINLGFIGVGRQGTGLGSRFFDLPETQIVAACDVDQTKLDRFVNDINQKYAEANGKGSYKGLKSYSKYEKLLKRKDIDGVVIATPDHWHAITSIDAMKAGKEVYCEKPLTHTIKEGRAIVNAVEKYEKVFQTGSMQRSSPNFREACELVRSGHLGEIKEVKVSVGDPPKPYNLPTEPTPDYIDWERWIGPSQMVGYHSDLAPPIPEQFWPKWRDYKEFGGGYTADWGAHMFDIAQWALGMDDSGPVEIIPPQDRSAVRGLKLIYENGVEMTHEDFGRGNAVRFIGTEGVVDISRQFLESLPNGLIRSNMKDDKVSLYKSDNHYQDWFDAIKTRKQPICHAEIGHRSASVCHLTNIGYALGRSLRWDPVKEAFKDDAEANKLTGKEYRSPYLLEA